MCDKVIATMTLLNDATAWIDKSIPPSITTKVIPAARMKSVAVSAITTKSGSAVKKLGRNAPIRVTNPSSRIMGIAALMVPGGARDLVIVCWDVIALIPCVESDRFGTVSGLERRRNER